ncbi:FecCD family ABC transporter permease [Microbacterium gorillae]|uniref:FecCD family ABC transporter permease n=1 Tax=Microbacterium gorillae TaxID=1231063 RepID=UPI003D98FC8D
MTSTLTPPASVATVLRRPMRVRLLALGGGAVLLVLLCASSVAFGAADVTLNDIIGALSGQSDTLAQAAVVKRMPRTVLAILVGAALAISGTGMQAVTRNPVADPGILGVTSGAALAVVCGIAFAGVTDPTVSIVLAVIGAALAAAFVYTVGSLGRGGATPLKLALAGAATTAALTSLVSAILLPRVDILQSVQSWQIGGVGGATWHRIAILTPVLVIGALICVASSRGMNSLALGDDLATGLGVHVARTRLMTTVGAVILAGAATAIAGPIAFVGLVVPHVCRMLVGTDHRWLVPFAGLAGACLLLAGDVLGRVIARPDEIQVGVVTAVIGAPFFIWIVRRQKVREL